MTSLLISNHNHYTSTHEAFKLSNLARWADRFGVDVFVRCFDDTPTLLHPRLHYTRAATDEDVIRDLDAILLRLKPAKLVNLVEGYFPWHLVDTNAVKVFFVRSCAAKMLDIIQNVLVKSEAGVSAIEAYTTRAQREEEYIRLSDSVITDSPTSQTVIKEYYGIDSSLCLEYIDPARYRMATPCNAKLIYNVGRTDFIKGLQFVRKPLGHLVMNIGQKELGDHHCVADHMVQYGWLDLDHYRPLIQDCVFGIFPALWESNGYAVQECLAMGKIPIVQSGSGGNERLCTVNNSILVDFAYGQTDWESQLAIDYSSMLEAARDTLTEPMYVASLEKFGNLIC
jgi:hypothetical protein